MTFSNELDLDGALFAIGYVNPPMPPSSFAAAPYQSLGMLSAGTHTLKLKVDSANQIVESNEVAIKYFNQAFVVTEYFGYLRRDPDALFLTWLAFLDANPGSSRTMVSGFMNSQEYRQRFGP